MGIARRFRKSFFEGRRAWRPFRRLKPLRRTGKGHRQVIEDASKRVDDAADTTEPSVARRRDDAAVRAKTVSVVSTAANMGIREIRLPGKWFDQFCRLIWKNTPELERMASIRKRFTGQARIDAVTVEIMAWEKRTGAKAIYVSPHKIPGYPGNLASIQGNNMLIANTYAKVDASGLRYLQEVAHDMGIYTTGKKTFVKGPSAMAKYGSSIDSTAQHWLDKGIGSGITSIDEIMALWWKYLSDVS